MTEDPKAPASRNDDHDSDDEQIAPLEGLMNPEDEPDFSPASDADAPAP